VQGFCASISRTDIAKNGDSLSPGRFIGTEDEEAESDEDFATRMTSLTEQLSAHLEKSHELEAVIRKNLGGLGYGI